MWQETSHRSARENCRRKEPKITLRDLERLALDGVSSVRELFCNVRIQPARHGGPDEGESKREGGEFSRGGCRRRGDGGEGREEGFSG